MHRGVNDMLWVSKTFPRLSDIRHEKNYGHTMRRNEYKEAKGRFIRKKRVNYQNLRTGRIQYYVILLIFGDDFSL